MEEKWIAKERRLGGNGGAADGAIRLYTSSGFRRQRNFLGQLAVSWGGMTKSKRRMPNGGTRIGVFAVSLAPLSRRGRVGKRVQLV